MRAALFLPVRLAQLRPAPGQLIALVLIGLGVQLLFAMLREGVPGELNITALPRALVYVPLLLLCGWVIARRERVPALLVAVPVLFCSASLPYDVAFEALDFVAVRGWFGLDDYDGGGRWLWYALYAAWLGAMIAGILRLAQAGLPRGLFHAAVFGVTIALPLWYLPSLPLWEASEADEAEGPDWNALSREEAFYAQPVLLDRALEALAPEREGVEDLYFVGVAGYAAEDVFMKEMAVVRELFRERFDADGRMITLVNNPKTAAQFPVASATALARTLDRIGEVLDPEEDVLFLYLTSHGSDDHRLAMQFWPLQLDDIDPAMLKQMLDESGIKWRVIVISACYSGGFIESAEGRSHDDRDRGGCPPHLFRLRVDLRFHVLRQGLLRRSPAAHPFVQGRLRPGPSQHRCARARRGPYAVQSADLRRRRHGREAAPAERAPAFHQASPAGQGAVAVAPGSSRLPRVR